MEGVTILLNKHIGSRLRDRRKKHAGLKWAPPWNMIRLTLDVSCSKRSPLCVVSVGMLSEQRDRQKVAPHTGIHLLPIFLLSPFISRAMLSSLHFSTPLAQLGNGVVAHHVAHLGFSVSHHTKHFLQYALVPFSSIRSLLCFAMWKKNKANITHYPSHIAS